MPRCFIALGGNVGPVTETFQHALAELARTPDVAVVRTSRIVRSAAVGERAGGEFQNAAAELATSLPPLELLDTLRRVEDRFGRVREHRWSPRTLDLDLNFYGSEIIDDPRLRVPHPACWYRRFVLDPLAEIAADFVHPEKKISVHALRSRLLSRPLTICLAGGNETEHENLILQLRGKCPPVWFDRWEASAVPPSQPAVIAWLGADGDSDPIEFDALPLVPRLDVSDIDPPDRLNFLRDVAVSALSTSCASEPV